MLLGKQLFYDAQDTRLARDAYMSCASCHNDGGHDGRAWDMTGFGEGLRNTAGLRGRAGAQGFLHWSNNFNEVQDFEGQIRELSGGSGLMTNADFNAGTRNEPLGDPRQGSPPTSTRLPPMSSRSNAFASSPLRNADGTLTSPATSGRAVFVARDCASATVARIHEELGQQPGEHRHDQRRQRKSPRGPLAGIDIPTLRDVWATAPYLHRGSAATLGDAIRAQAGVTVTDPEIANLVAYVAQIGGQEAPPPAARRAARPTPAPGFVATISTT